METNLRLSKIAVSPLKFFGLTFILSWLIWIPLAMSHFGIGPFQVSESASGIIRLLGVLMPAVSALVLTALASGRRGLRSLGSRLVLWRVPLKWWAVAVLVQPLILGLTAWIFNLAGGKPAIQPAALASLSEWIVNVVFLLIASMGEEIGWRGVALPALQERNSAVRSSIILGLVWATWHLPFWLLLDTFTQFGFGYLVLNFLLIVPTNAYITWFFNHGRYSILLAVCFHLAFNIVNTALLPVTLNITAFGIFIALQWVLTFFVLPHLESEQVKALRYAFQ